MSPAAYYSSGTGANVWYISDYGSISFDYVNFYSTAYNYVYGLRPVINLNANILATGTGTSSDPYVVKTN